MALEEIYAQVIREADSVNRKATAYAQVYVAELLRKKKKQEIRTISYTSPHRNSWKIVLRVQPFEVNMQAYIPSSDAKGVVAYAVQPEGKVNYLIKYNGHFFKRYKERLHLDLVQPEDVMHHFFRNNIRADVGETTPFENGLCMVQYVYEQGIGIGWLDQSLHIQIMKTFVSNDMLHPQQIALNEYIKRYDDSEEFTSYVKAEHVKKAGF